MSVTLEIPGAVVDAMHLPAPEVAPRMRLELAVSLYAQHILGLGKAAELAGISRVELNEVLARRSVPMHYGPEELEEDLAHARTFAGRRQ
jgi:predicted HTH domain antitoxin